MADTTPRGIVYAEAGDHTRLWEHYQDQAESVDAALATPACQLLQTSNQSIPNNAVTVLNMDSTVYDTDGMADLSNNRIEIQTAGIYLLTASIRWNIVTGSRMQISIGVNGSVIDGNSVNATSGTNPYNTSHPTLLAQGDLVTAHAFQTSGASQNTTTASGWQTPSVAAVWIGRNL